MIQITIKFIFVIWIIIIFIRNILYTIPSFQKYTFPNNLLFSIIFPVWNVFSPIPINSDIRVFYRDMYYDGEVTGLNEFIFYKTNSLFFFDLYQRERKFIYSIYQLLSRYKEGTVTEAKEYKDFKQYLSLKNYSKNIKTRQLVVIRTFGFITNEEKKIELIDYINYDKS